MYDPSIRFDSDGHIATMAGAGVALLLTLYLFRGMHHKISVVRKKGMLWTPMARKRLGFFYEAYKTECASFELVSLLRRGVAIATSVFLRNFPVPQGLEQLGISIAYLVVVWRWRPFEWHEASIPRGCCGIGWKPWNVQARQLFFLRNTISDQTCCHCTRHTARILIPAELLLAAV